jgi:glycosyltransferase involved in cell wall biosynthesis
MADKVFVLSSDMEDSLLRRPKGGEIKTCVINNFSMPVFDSQKEEPALLKKKGSFRIVFAGNIGRFQCLDAFVGAMKLLGEFVDIDFVFMGEGARLTALKQKSSGIDSILFFPHQKVSVAQKVIADCNLGVVSLQHEIYKYAFPSKTMAYLSEGCPLLVAVESKSKLADFVISKHIGVTAEPGSSVSIATAIKSVYKNKKLHAELKSNALNVSKTFFDSRNVLDLWSRQFT